jgi:hypothetical protein
VVVVPVVPEFIPETPETAVAIEIKEMALD